MCRSRSIKKPDVHGHCSGPPSKFFAAIPSFSRGRIHLGALSRRFFFSRGQARSIVAIPAKQSRGIEAVPERPSPANFVFKNPDDFLSDHAAIPADDGLKSGPARDESSTLIPGEKFKLQFPAPGPARGEFSSSRGPATEATKSRRKVFFPPAATYDEFSAPIPGQVIPAILCQLRILSASVPF